MKPCRNRPDGQHRFLSRSRTQRPDGTWTEWKYHCSWCGKDAE